MRRFRAWHTKLNRYLKDDEFYVDSDGSVYSSFETYDDEILETDYIENFSRDDFNNGYVIREDDTGLKDKNGKEIYEGDILESTWNCDRAVVVWNDVEGEWEHYADFNTHSKYSGSVVIGNIHENPELLEEEE